MDKESIKLQLLAIPSFLLLGLGINSLFSRIEVKIHPMLENQSIGIALIALGGIGAALAFYKGLIIFRNRSLNKSNITIR